MEWLSLLLLGSIVGFLAGLFGIGGGLILVPSLAFLLPALGIADTDHALAVAIATSLTSVAATGSSAAMTHIRSGKVDWPSVKKLTGGLMIGSICGALLTDILPTSILGLIFGVLEILIGIQMLIGKQPHQDKPPASWMLSSGFGWLSGMMSALLGIGGGTVNTPWLVWHGMPLAQAISTSSVLGVVIALAGTATHLTSDLIHWSTLLMIISTSLLTAPLGARLTHRLPISSLKRGFSLLLLFLGAVMLSKFMG